MRGRGGASCRFDCLQKFVLRQCNTGRYGIRLVLRPLDWAVSPVVPSATSDLAVLSERTLPLSSRPV